MDVFPRRERQRFTPRPRIRLTDTSPNYRFDTSMKNTTARFRANEFNYDSYDNEKNTNARSGARRDNKSFNKQTNARFRAREFMNTQYRDLNWQPEYSHIGRVPVSRGSSRLGSSRLVSAFHPDQHYEVVGPNRPPNRRQIKRQRNRAKHTQFATASNVDAEIDNHAEREFFVEQDALLEEDFPQQYNEFDLLPTQNFRGRPAPCDFPSRSSSARRVKSVSFVNHGGRFCDDEVSLDRGTRPHMSERNRFPRFFPQEREEGRFNNLKQRLLRSTTHIPAPPRLKVAIKRMYDLIRLVHHLGKVTTKVRDNQPITFQRLAGILIETVHPASPNDQVLQMLEGNAKNWSFTTQLILEQHYEGLIDETIKSIREQTDQADWPKAFEIASNWAHRNFRGRVSPETIEQAEALITAELSEANDRAIPSVIAEEQVSEPPRTCTFAEVVASDSQLLARTTPTPLPLVSAPPILVRPKAGAHHIEVQTSPSLLGERGVSKSPPSRRDWSFEGELPPAGLKPALQPIQALALSPQKQRTRKTRTHQSRTLEVGQPLAVEGTHHWSDRGVVSIPQRDGSPQELVDSEEEKSIDSPLPLAQPCAATSDPSQHSSIELFSDRSGDSNRTGSPLSRFLKEYEPSQNPGVPLEPIIKVIHVRPSDSQHSSPVKDRLRGEVNIKSLRRPIEVVEQGELHYIQPSPLPAQPQLVDITAAGTQSPAPLTPSSIGRPIRHVNTTRKLFDWNLTLRKRFVIIGDSNLHRFPPFQYPDLQVDSFPGAKWQHAGNLIEKASIVVKPEKIILSFGLNNRRQRYRMTAITEIQRAYRAVQQRLPDTELFCPLINFSRTLPMEEQLMLEHINGHIKKNMNFIPLLPTAQFQVDDDGVHWRSMTAKSMLAHWATHLNLQLVPAQ